MIMSVNKQDKIYIETLGCPKNNVDSELMAHHLTESGWKVVSKLSEADIAIVNTCAFIDEAKAESIEAIWNLVAAKERGRIEKVVVAGCLAERYGEVLVDEIPELDAVFGNRDPREISNVLAETISNPEKTRYIAPKNYIYNWYEHTTHAETLHQGWAYLKITEGCDNNCSYCAIPSIRGKLRSAPMDSILKQAEQILASGAKEIVLVGQETTAYGLDFGQNLFPKLLRRLSEIDGDFGIRVLYAHPRHMTTENIEAIVETPKLLPYLDLPIQHISDNMLESMNRHVNGKQIRETISVLREMRPEIVLRTSVITGFPGETEDDFNELVEFIDEGHFIHGGVFAFSSEDGTAAASFDNAVPSELAEERKLLIEMVFDRIKQDANEALEDKTMRVLVEQKGPRPGLMWGRTPYDAPEIDRMVRFRGEANVAEFANVRILKGAGFHLLGVKE